MKRHVVILQVVLFLLIALLSFQIFARIQFAYAQPTWPSSWIQIDWDRNENGAIDDWRDVKYAYYQYDSTYLYLKLECYDVPGKEWPLKKEGRYKWFIDLDGNMYYSGGNVYDAEYLLFVEDTDYNGAGEMYLLFDANYDNCFGEYEPWPPANYANYKITDSNIGGWRIVTSTKQIEMYIKWTSIGSPTSYWLFWSTDQQNPNLDQAPTTDRVDEGTRIGVHNVAAVSQTPTPTVVKQGEHVTIQVVVENKGTLKESFSVTCYFNSTVIGTQRVTNLGAGRQATLTFDWDTTGLPAGNYQIKAWADSNAEICETNEQDNWCTSPAIVTIQSALVHDVAAISQVPDRWNATQGMIVNINVTVSNLGDFTETFNVTCFYDNNPISYQTVTNLAKKTTTSIIFAWNTAGVQPNTYYIRAMADSSRIITEINENNNNCTTLQTITIYSPDQMGKLFVDKVKTAVISGEDPPVVNLPSVYELTIIVTNIGGSDVSNIIVNETISSDVTFVSVGTPSQGSITALPPPKIVWSVGTLSHGANATLKFRIRITPLSLGLKYLNHKEDLVAKGKDIAGNTVSDIGDTDITVDPIIRDVAAISQVPTSTIVCQGDTVTIHVTVKNYGNVSETFDVTCYYDSNQIGVIRVYNLGNGSQTTVPFAWDTTGVAPGTYSISAKADSSNEIAETDETNNICTSPTTIKIVIHDVAIIIQSPSPTNVVQGDTVTIEVIVRNEGTEPETFTVSCYINDTLLETKTVTNLAPSTTIPLAFLWDTTGAKAGKYYINTEASTVPGEKDTDDNACRSVNTVTVTLPKYQVTFTHTGLDDSALGTVVKVNDTTVGYGALPYTLLVDKGTTITYTYYNVSSSISGKRFNLTSITGPQSPIIVTSDITVIGNYKTQFEIKFNCSGVTEDVVTPVVTIDGKDYGLCDLPKFFWWDNESTHNFAFQSPLLIKVYPYPKRFVWISTSGLSTVQSGSIKVSTSGFVMGNYKTQYEVTVTASPAGAIGGTFKVTYTQCGTTYTNSQKTTSWTEWVDVDTYVTLSESQDIIQVSLNMRYKFDHYDPSSNVLMNEAKNITLVYKTQYQVTVTASPSGVLGGTFKVTYIKCGTTYTNVQKTTTWTEWVDANTYVTVSDPQNIINGYQFDQYNPSATLFMDQAKTITLVYKTIPAFTVSITPTSAKIKVGESANFASTVSGGVPSYSYQWFLNGAAVSGAKDPTWIFVPTNPGTYSIYLNVTDSTYKVAKSNTASVTVAPPLKVSITPTSATIPVGQSVAFMSTVSGGYSPYSYQWYLNGVPVSEAKSATWTFKPSSSGVYYVYLEVKDSNDNTAQSETARISVVVLPVGGYSIPLVKQTSNSSTTHITAYLTLIALLGAVVSLIKRKRK